MGAFDQRFPVRSYLTDRVHRGSLDIDRVRNLKSSL